MTHETVRILDRGREIEVPKHIWDTIKKHDLTTAPVSIKNMARAYGLSISKIIMVDK